jgi:hypothetical protein
MPNDPLLSKSNLIASCRHQRFVSLRFAPSSINQITIDENICRGQKGKSCLSYSRAARMPATTKLKDGVNSYRESVFVGYSRKPAYSGGSMK